MTLLEGRFRSYFKSIHHYTPNTIKEAGASRLSNSVHIETKAYIQDNINKNYNVKLKL
ncbi:hypothetical protein CONCODRAFT_12626 [Conidiobolus coronatus NRRL 28638]|uniref:Uncharacterized protein n=1 Tax=Conidiobolus coronatus (strain ATCC 28846 / CBS 209.66 / NRRL 28638) TaxID=796925 RepID=A0A137NSN8_CONC2|nr:hypothetical protein CONCODRAFT_12626 [Conidiobolus coronatus NRRL 28638]|eukprot:KXN65710.1 hypothetical protein CONCODRAFT_12626 [Conidiobolus coronatus NRRL 28638]